MKADKENVCKTSLFLNGLILVESRMTKKILCIHWNLEKDSSRMYVNLRINAIFDPRRW